MNYIMVRILIDSAIMSTCVAAMLVLVFAINPRIALSDFPEEIKTAVPPRTKKELRQGILLSLPVLLAILGIPLTSLWLINRETVSITYLTAFITLLAELLVFFFFDLLVLDIWLFHGLTPKFMVIPGTEGMPGYKNYTHHLKAHFTRGLPKLIVFSALLAFVPVWLF